MSRSKKKQGGRKGGRKEGRKEGRKMVIDAPFCRLGTTTTNYKNRSHHKYVRSKCLPRAHTLKTMQTSCFSAVCMIFNYQRNKN